MAVVMQTSALIPRNPKVHKETVEKSSLARSGLCACGICFVGISHLPL